MYSSENNMNDFKEWLEKEMHEREWSMADLARYAGVARGSVANVLRGDRNPGKDFCDGISRAFKISPEVVYRRAGLLPPQSYGDENRQELIHLYDLMSESSREDIIDFARMKLKKEERESKNKNGKRDKIA